MSEINFDSFKVRCSAISKVLSESRDNPTLTENQEKLLQKYREKLDAGGIITPNQQIEFTALRQKEANGSKLILSDTCIEYLMVEYAWATEGMISVNREALDLVATKKGNMTEGESGDLLIRVDKLPYKQHKDRIYNDFLSGEIDLYAGEHVMSAEIIVDIKQSFDYPTFLKKIHTKVDKSNDFQVKGYQDITGARIGYIADTLITCPPEVVNAMQWKLVNKMNALTTESPEFVLEWAKWEHSMNFDKIPIHKRVHKKKITPLTEFEKSWLYDEVKKCRQWLNDFHEQYQKMNLV